MTAELTLRIQETTRAVDALLAVWPEGRPNVSMHGLPHEVIHAISGHQEAFQVPANGPDYWVLRIDVRSAQGERVDFFGRPDPSCETCAGLMRPATGCQVCGEPHGVSVPCGFRRSQS